MRLALAIALAACGGSSRPAARPIAATAVASAAPVIASPLDIAFEGTTSASIVPIEPTCTEGAEEACNALDDDCDAMIDDGCGYSNGQLQITFGWSGGADLDLYVIDPNGYTLSYQNRESPSGAILDRDGRGACGTPEASTENVFWPRRPPDGRYRVEVHHWGVCGSPGEVRGHLSVSVGGTIAAVYQVVLRPRQREVVTVFDIGGDPS